MGSWRIKREGQLSLGQIYISKMLLILLFQKLYACVKSLENCQLLPVHNIFTLRGNTAQNSWNSYIFIPNKEFYSLPFWYWLQQITIAIRSLSSTDEFWCLPESYATSYSSQFVYSTKNCTRYFKLLILQKNILLGTDFWSDIA